MARIRSIKPNFWGDEKLATVSRDARLTFIGLLTFADDYGVVKGHPLWLKNNIYPYDDLTTRDFQLWLNELESLGVIMPFSHNGENFIVIVKFSKHQKIDRKSRQRNAEELLKGLDDSMTIQRALVEHSAKPQRVSSVGLGCRSSDAEVQSSEEGEGTGEREKPKVKDSSLSNENPNPKPKDQEKAKPQNHSDARFKDICYCLQNQQRFGEALRYIEFEFSPKDIDELYRFIWDQKRKVGAAFGDAQIGALVVKKADELASGKVKGSRAR